MIQPLRQHIYPERVACPLLCEKEPRFLRRNNTLRIYECQECYIQFSVAPIPPKIRAKATEAATSPIADESKDDGSKKLAPIDQRIDSPPPSGRGGKPA